MKRAIWIGVLAVLAFAAILLVRLPASWFASALPSDVSCAQIDGTVWHGSCDGFVWRKVALGNLNWKLHAASLLSGVLRARLAMAGPVGIAEGIVEARRDERIVARDLRAEFELNPALIPSMPTDLRGRVRTDLKLLQVEDGIVTGIEGSIEAHDLERHGRQMEPLGDYVVTFPAAGGGEPVGDVRSLRGPLDIEGELKLTREPGFVLDGTVATGVGASPDLIQQLRALGSPDARGRRVFSVAGTF